jgi:hypothetical protein
MSPRLSGQSDVGGRSIDALSSRTEHLAVREPSPGSRTCGPSSSLTCHHRPSWASRVPTASSTRRSSLTGSPPGCCWHPAAGSGQCSGSAARAAAALPLGLRARLGPLQPVQQPSHTLARPDLAQHRGRHGVRGRSLPAIAGQEPGIRQQHRIRAGLDDRGISQPGGRLDVHHPYRPVRAGQQEIRHVTADTAAVCARSRNGWADRRRNRVEVGQQQAGKLKPALVDDVTGGRRRPVTPDSGPGHGHCGPPATVPRSRPGQTSPGAVTALSLSRRLAGPARTARATACRPRPGHRERDLLWPYRLRKRR